MERKLFIDHGGATAEGKFKELPDRIRNTMPHREPSYDPEVGVIYRVLEPFYTKECIDDVNEAMRNGEISSGTRWPRRMAENVGISSAGTLWPRRTMAENVGGDSGPLRYVEVLILVRCCVLDVALLVLVWGMRNYWHTCTEDHVLKNYIPKKLIHISFQICALYRVPVAIPTSSGASALHVALLSLSVYQNEVIVPAFTMVAVANAVKLAGGLVVYADSRPDNINPGLFEIQKVYSVRTKAVILCHTYGIAVDDIAEIAAWCREKNIFLIEDICECMGARLSERSVEEVTTPSGSVVHGPILGERSGSSDSFDIEVGRYVLAGCYGDLSCSSLYANKQVTAGDGGWVHARDAKHGPRLKSLVNHGFDPAFHFLHFETAPNGKINGLGAAFICRQLGENLHQQVEKRHQVAGWYRTALDEARGRIAAAKGDGVMLRGINEACCKTTFFDAPWVFGIETDKTLTRNALRQYLADHGIESRNYFFPLHLQPVNYFEYKV